jgi:nicotinamide-nucleotide amidase
LPYIENKFGIKSKRLTLKYFGDKKALYRTVEDATPLNGNIVVNIKEKHGDYTVEVLFKDGTDDTDRTDFIRRVVGELKDGIYAEFDTTLGERLFDLLKLKSKTLAVAESFTGGRIVSEMIKNPGVSEFLHEGVVSYSNKSKTDRLGVKQEDLMKSGAVSSIVAYQMSAGLLTSGNCDISIATTGIAGPKSDDTLKPVGLCYIAVGMKDGVHTYRFVFKGDREEITETAKNTALFLAIKKLKSI